MTIVVDTSVAVKFTIDEVDTDAALALIANEPDLVAPDLILVQAANAFWVRVRRPTLLEPHALAHLRAFPDFFRRLWPASELIDDALSVALALRHPIYDCVFLALARRLEGQLVTADRKFVDKLATSPFASNARLLAA